MTSSRLCVKHLPKHTGEQELRRHFTGDWNLTDVKVVRSRDGASRQFGYVGFETAEDAGAAKNFLDRTFMGASRLSIEFARQMKDDQASRPWSKHTKGSSAHDRAHGAVNSTTTSKLMKKRQDKRSEVQEMGLSEQDNVKLQEFLELMQPRSKAKSWGNDDMAVEDDLHSRKVETVTSSDEGSAGDLEELEGTSADEEINERNHDVSLELSDMDYLRSRVSTAFDDGGEEDEEVESQDGHSSGVSCSELEEIMSDEDIGGQNQDTDTIAHSDPISKARNGSMVPGESTRDINPVDSLEVVKQTKKLFVRNLPYKANEKDLIDLFEEFGDVVDVQLATDKKTSRSKGFALITFGNADAAVNAFHKMDGQIFMGRLLHVLPGNSHASSSEIDNTNAGKLKGGFKAEKEAQKRGDAGNRATWNTLFMRADTVVEAVAEHYGVKKSELMDRDASDLGVRMALGETQVIAKTKEALGEAGVDIEVLEEAALAAGKASDTVSVSRSNTVLLIKNLPYKSDGDELLGLFGTFGSISRLVLPPSKVLALVEYSESSAAVKAFRGLAYKNYHGVPLYLEWAPKGVFPVPAIGPPLAQKSTANGSLQHNHQTIEDQAATEIDMLPDTNLEAANAEDSGDEDSRPGSTLFVKNLAFSTTELGLKSHFDGVVSEIGGALRSVILATKLRSDGKRMSAGYGFVELDSDAAVKHTINKLQGSLLDGHKLELQRSSPKTQMSKVVAVAANARKRKLPKEKTTKLLVRNLAFEATKKDLLGLFGPFGHIKTCRIPKKFDGTHRGFAFIDFITKHEAESAKDGVSGAHLYGRRLVIEYAKADDGGLDELRMRTGQKFTEGLNDGGQKKLRT